MVELFESTLVDAPVERTFDLARSVEVHLLGNTHRGEEVVAGKGSGLIGPGESVTWRARHLGVRQTLTGAITGWRPPVYFRDTMQRGAFHSLEHDHFFLALPVRPGEPPRTEMRDVLRFAAPLGVLGLVAERLVLRRYMQAFLRERNAAIQEVAAHGVWRRYLPTTGDASAGTGV